MPLEFEWDAAKADRNFKKHGVNFTEAVTVFSDSRSITLNDPDHALTENRYSDIGFSSAGRLLLGVYTERGSRIRIIPANASLAKPTFMTKANDRPAPSNLVHPVNPLRLTP